MIRFTLCRLLPCLVIFIRATESEGLDYHWKGKWFPNAPNQGIDDDTIDDPDAMEMGVKNPICDDANTNLAIDWSGSPDDYTCFANRENYLPNPNIHPILHCDHIPPGYSAAHVCMNSSIQYPHSIPTYGSHRPLWAAYGEYRYIPPQRWVHNLEHGAVVMLYHPCANKHEIKLLKSLVTGCLYRHVITPNAELPADTPLALVTWSCRFLMSKVDPDLVIEFIKRTALRGPEDLETDGQYILELIRHAKIVSVERDTSLCPNIIM